jgi:UPF0716 family protein affecting phage T7 exclusion
VNPRNAGCLVVGLWPFLELFILLFAASAWGWQPVLIIILVTGAVGLAVIRLGIVTTGRSLSEAMRLLQQRTEENTGQQDDSTIRELPAGSLANADDLPLTPESMAPPAQSILLIPAGVLLALPGFIGDAVGLTMLIPAVRRAIAKRWQARMNP